MTPSAEELLAIVRQYWPATHDAHSSQEKSPEAKRLEALWTQALRRMDEWRALLLDLRHELPGFRIGQMTATCDACFRCGAYPPAAQLRPSFEWVVVGCMSILAPVYTVYGVQYEYRGKERIRDQVFLSDLPPEMHGPAAAMSRRIESRFGVSPLPPEIAATPVPLFVDLKEPPRTTLFHALFSSEPQSVP